MPGAVLHAALEGPTDKRGMDISQQAMGTVKPYVREKHMR